MSALTLPPEIVDKILENIPTYKEGWPTLIACALVATWWTGPSQRRLFSSVQIYPRNHERFVTSVILPEPKTHLLGHIRSLVHYHRHDCQLRDLAQDCGEYFSALCNLHSLTCYSIEVGGISGGGSPTYFSPFRETLTYLSLRGFTTSFSAFVTLVDYFPNITTLWLDWFTLGPDEKPVLPLSRPLRGKLRVCEVESSCLEFFDRLAELGLEYEELVLDSHSPMKRKFVESVLRISTSTVKFLRFTRRLHREYPLPALLTEIIPLPNPPTPKTITKAR